MSFRREVEKFRKEFDGRQTDLLQSVSLEVFKRVIEKTPVDTGRARGNWQAGLNVAVQGQLEAVDKNGQPTNAKANKVVSGAKATDTITLANNLPYIQRLEDGSSTQAPNGMVKTTVIEFSGIVEDVLREKIR